MKFFCLRLYFLSILLFSSLFIYSSDGVYRALIPFCVKYQTRRLEDLQQRAMVAFSHKKRNLLERAESAKCDVLKLKGASAEELHGRLEGIVLSLTGLHYRDYCSFRVLSRQLTDAAAFEKMFKRWCSWAETGQYYCDGMFGPINLEIDEMDKLELGHLLETIKESRNVS
ncbi:hypothetical protein HN446_04650 [bacterium]|jgi:hypothetical protein|nr:hypothetical protein [bacterium]